VRFVYFVPARCSVDQSYSMAETGTKGRRRYRKLKKLQDLSDLSALPHECERAALILQHAHSTASALFKAYQLLRRKRGAERGMTTDEEQDLLRAMLVMTAAGLDGMAKQLVRDTLRTLVMKQTTAQKQLRDFIARHLRGTADSTEKFLADILSVEKPFERIIERYIRDLTAGSLQSVDEILSTAAALGVEKRDLESYTGKLKDIFHVRNSIVHELDMNLTGARRKRNIRREADMVAMVEFLFGFSSALITKVASNLKIPD